MKCTELFWDAKLQRWFISKEHIQQLEQRFVITRLDGSVDEDRRACIVPADWTDEQFQEEIQLVFATVLQERLNKHNNTVRDKIEAIPLLCGQSQNIARHEVQSSETGRSYKKGFCWLVE